MHSIINQLIPPNVVNYSRKFKAKLFNGLQQEFLLILKVNLVEVYTVELASTDCALKLFSQHTFAARIESLEVQQRNDSDSDWIFMTFSDCKVNLFSFIKILFSCF